MLAVTLTLPWAAMAARATRMPSLPAPGLLLEHVHSAFASEAGRTLEDRLGPEYGMS